MTDRDLVIELCKRLQLSENHEALDDPNDIPDLGDEQFHAGPHAITLGAGNGYNGFYVRFFFDASGALAGHVVME